jgi:hypothetical protein
LNYFYAVSIAAEKIAAEALALPGGERALLAREIAGGKVHCRPVEEAVRDIRSKLHVARRQPS